MKFIKVSLVLRLACALAVFASTTSIFANIPGGGTGAGANVTVTDNGSTVTMANGIVSIVITKTDASIHAINYTFNNTGGSQTINVLSGGSSGGELYWFQNGGSFIDGPFTESVVANNGSYAEISLSYASPTNGIMDIHYSMLRGSPGFYTTPILTHRSQDGTIHVELRPNIYAGATFNWMSVDAARNRLMEVSGGTAIGVQGAPVECSLWTTGIYAGQYEDKYKYTADLAGLPAWGWSSVGAGGKNIGLWNVSASPEYYPGGPMERSLMEHIGTTILNVFTGGYFGLGTDDNFSNGEIWTKVYGPYFYYLNNVPNTITATNVAAQALYADALAQGAAEQSAWPYSWFTNVNYVAASGRGTVTGQIIIADSGNPNASSSNLWVGVVRQPSTTASIYDFQEWAKPYQFWVRTDADGNFSIPNVIATNNYTLYAFGPGAEGTFMSQNQTGGNPALLFNLPASPFSVTVTGGATNNLGTVTWTPTRVGPTVFEIGYPDRTAYKFRHGDDWWVGDIGPNAVNPSPIWTKYLEFPFEFPSGPNYVVGQSRWTTDWNFIQPVITSSTGTYNNSSSTITFNLASKPANGTQASLFMALTSDYYAALIVSINGTIIASGSGGVTATPSSLPSSGFVPTYSRSDASIREGNNGANSDERITFPGTLLRSGANTITFTTRQVGGSYFADHAMYDYIRLELTGYIPPAPGSVSAYAGNNCNLVCWPVTPGATGYNILRSTTSGSGYVSVTNGVTGPVCGSGWNNATYLDTNAINDTTYYYIVQSVNSVGSTNSPQSSGVTPSADLSASAPAAPEGLTVSNSGHHNVTLNWSASSGANFYSVFRSTLINNGGGASNTLSTIVLNNTNTGTSYTDTTPTDGSIYSYSVTATSAGGTSGNSAPVFVRPLPAPPATAPASLTAVPLQATNITLNWSAVSGAVGYVISRSTAATGSFTLLQSITETTYTDNGLSTNISYYYRVTPVNAGGVTTNGITTTRPTAPASLSAVAGNAQVTLTWPASIGATGYVILRSGNIIASGITTLNYTNTGLANGTTYNYTVQAIGTAATSGNSQQASATPATPATTTTLNSLSDVTYGTAVTLSASVSPVPADGDNVTFKDGSTVLGSGLVTGGVATYTTASVQLAAGSHSITAVFAGDANYSSSTSGISNQVVNAEPVTPIITLNSKAYDGTAAATTIATRSLTGVIGGDDVNLGASGTVETFTNQNTGSYNVNISGLSLSGASAGNYILTSTTATATAIITPASSITTIISTTNPAPYEADITFTATVTGADTPTGSVQFLTNGVLFDTEPLVAGTATSADTTLLPPGTNIITGIYSGDVNYAGSTNTLGQGITVAQFNAINVGGNGLVLGGSGGLPNGTYHVLVSTNMTAPFADWTPMLTNHFDASGNFNFTNGMDTNIPQGFYIIQLP